MKETITLETKILDEIYSELYDRRCGFEVKAAEKKDEDYMEEARRIHKLMSDFMDSRGLFIPLIHSKLLEVDFDED